MAPEQITRGEATVATDVFSLAVVAYEAPTGRKPFEGETITPILWCQVNTEPRLPSRPDLPFHMTTPPSSLAKDPRPVFRVQELGRPRPERLARAPESRPRCNRLVHAPARQPWKPSTSSNAFIAHTTLATAPMGGRGGDWLCGGGGPDRHDPALVARTSDGGVSPTWARDRNPPDRRRGVRGRRLDGERTALHHTRASRHPRGEGDSRGLRSRGAEPGGNRRGPSDPAPFYLAALDGDIADRVRAVAGLGQAGRPSRHHPGPSATCAGCPRATREAGFRPGCGR
jgi:hypothetical protein